jgi:hypothetical protein
MTFGHRVGPAAARLTAVLLAAVGLAACGGGASVSAPLSDGAARVVPADALAYVSVDLDTRTGAVAQTVATLAQLRGYRHVLTAVRRRLSEITGVGFAAGIRPWLGAEAAVAFVPAGARASELIVLGVGHRAGAERFSARVQAATDGVVAARLLDGYVVIGQPAAVAHAAHARSLATSPGFQRALAAAPGDRVLDAYATGPGVTELLGGHAGLAGVVAEVMAAARPASVAAALAPTSDGLRVWVRLSGADRPTDAFTPTLADRLPARTTWMVDMPSLTASGPGLLAALAAGTGGATAGLGGLIGRLGTALRAQGVALGPLEALFDHESAIFELDGSLGLITRTADAKAARLELGAAGQALAELFAPPAGAEVEPVVSTVTVGHVAVTQYQTGPSAQLDDAVFDHDVVITTSHAALVAIIDRKATLSGSSLYQSVLAGSGRSVSPILYGAINRLIRRGGETGPLEQLGLSGTAPALAQISAAGLASTGTPSETTAELYFTIS